MPVASLMWPHVSYLVDWTYAAVPSPTCRLPISPHTHTHNHPSIISLRATPDLAHTSQPRIALIDVTPVLCVCAVPVSLCPLRLQGPAPLIWPSLHLIHLSRLQSEDQKDRHGSVQVTSSYLLSFTPLLHCCLLLLSGLGLIPDDAWVPLLCGLLVHFSDLSAHVSRRFLVGSM